MKNRILSLVLALIIATSAFIVAAPLVGAATGDGTVKPITEYKRGLIGFTGRSVLPLDGIKLYGEKIDTAIMWDTEDIAVANQSSKVLLFDKTNEPLSKSGGLIFYIDVPAANIVVPIISLAIDETRWNKTYNPEMSLYAGNTYYYKSVEADEWQSGIAVKARSSNGSVSSYQAGIKFSEGFKGYIKIPFASLKHDNGYTVKNTDVMIQLSYRFKTVGGSYGAVAVGPNLLYTTDFTGDVVYPDEFVEKTSTEAKIPSDYSVVGYNVTRTESNLGVGIDAMTSTLEKSSEYFASTGNLYTGSTPVLVMQGTQTADDKPINMPMSDTEGVLFYVKTECANKLAFTMNVVKPSDTTRWKWSWLPELSPIVGKSYEYLEKGTNEWKKASFVCGYYENSAPNQYKAAVEFDDAFEGYVRIPYSSMGNNSGFKLDPALDYLHSIAFRFEKIGGSYGSIDILPFVLVRKSGEGNRIEIKQSYPITVMPSLNGSITVDKTAAAVGEKVYVTVTPNSGYRLAPDGLKINYTDFSGEKQMIVGEKAEGLGLGNGSRFVFTMPETTALSICAEFISADAVSLALLEGVSGNNSLAFKLRVNDGNIGEYKAGMLIAKASALNGMIPTHTLSGIQLLDVPLDILSDETASTAASEVEFSDYILYLNNIIKNNLSEDFAVRPYILVDGKYIYGKTAMFNHNDLTPKYPFIDYESFGNTVEAKNSGYINRNMAESPVPFYSSDEVMLLSCKSTAVDLSQAEVSGSKYWASASYNEVSVRAADAFAFYVKVPEGKENYLCFELQDTNNTGYKIGAEVSYSLWSREASAWSKHRSLASSNIQNGCIMLPAGFEGFVKIPYSSISSFEPDKTLLKNISYRFSYIGTGENAVTVGAVLSVFDKDEASQAVIVDELPASTTSLAVNQIKDEDIASDSVTVYWEATSEALSYRIKAYQPISSGYLEAASNTVYSNSGTALGLNDNTEYYIVIEALDKSNAVIATYNSVKCKTAPGSMVEVGESCEISYDTADATAAISRSYTTLSAENSVLLHNNPNRGFRGAFELYHYDSSASGIAAVKKKLDSAVGKMNKYHTASTYVVYFYLGDYAESDIGDEVFEVMQYCFDYFRENKIQMLLRFAYRDYFEFTENKATTLWTLKHINQISQNGIIERNKDVLHAFQAGFVGYFGEWHGDAGVIDRTAVLTAFMEELLPEGIYTQVRMPSYKELISDSKEYKKYIGYHKDDYHGILDATTIGQSDSYSVGHEDWNRQLADGAYTPNDAELYWYSQFIDNNIYPDGYASIIGASQLRLTTLSGINGYLDQGPFTDGAMVRWKSQPITAKFLEYNGLNYSDSWFKNANGDTVKRSVFDYMYDYLGYRFSAKSLSTSLSGNNLSVDLKLVNYGFSAGFNLNSEIVILDESGNVVSSAAFGNPENWHPTDPDNYANRTILEHSISADLNMPTDAGTYRIALRISNAVDATARLDNNIPYEGGYNILHTFNQ